MSLCERFEKFVAPPNERGCKLWTGSRKGKGYGAFRLEGKMQIASRVSYLLYKGSPDGQLVCHTCNTPLCVNPDHLYLGTYSDNTKQAVAEGRQYTPSGEKNNSAKLTRKQVEEIRSDHRTQRPIAKDYGISQLHVSRIKRGLVWA